MTETTAAATPGSPRISPAWLLLPALMLAALVFVLITIHNKPIDKAPPTCGDMVNAYVDSYYDQHGTIPTDIQTYREALPEC